MHSLEYLLEREARDAGGKAYGVWLMEQEFKKRRGRDRHSVEGLQLPLTWVMPPFFANLDHAVSRLDHNKKYAVRSSGPDEDGMLSYAGQHLTLLDVSHSDLPDAIVRVRLSALDSNSYRMAHGLGEAKPMTVLVQSMVHPVRAGVLFTGDPIVPDIDSIVLEYVTGLGVGLVGGERKPTKSWRGKWPLQDQERPKWWTPRFTALVEMGKVLEGRLGGLPVDIEWAQTTAVTYLLQLRSMTGVLWKKVVKGEGIGDGEVEGTVQRRGERGVGREFVEGNVLVTRMTSPRMIGDMLRASAIVTEIGGVTCHAAIVARELGKPCVVGCGGARLLTSGQRVRVRAREGVVEVVS